MAINKLKFSHKFLGIIFILMCICLLAICFPKTDAKNHIRHESSTLEQCTKSVQITKETDSLLADDTRLRKDWCKIADQRVGVPPIKLVLSRNDQSTGMYYETCKPAALVLDEETLKLDHSALMFVLAHEYEHFRFDHHIYKNLANILVFLSVFFCVLLCAEIKNQSSLVIVFLGTFFFLIPLEAYQFSFSKFIEKENVADLGAYKNLEKLGVDAVKASNELFNFGNKKGHDTVPASAPGCLLKSGVMVTTCNPHPTPNQRKEYLEKHNLKHNQTQKKDHMPTFVDSFLWVNPLGTFIAGVFVFYLNERNGRRKLRIEKLEKIYMLCQKLFDGHKKQVDNSRNNLPSKPKDYIKNRTHPGEEMSEIKMLVRSYFPELEPKMKNLNAAHNFLKTEFVLIDNQLTNPSFVKSNIKHPENAQLFLDTLSKGSNEVKAAVSEKLIAESKFKFPWC